MSLYLGDNLVSGVATPIQGARNIGQIIQSTIPLTDAGLHLLDGTLINGSGIYSDFVTYIAGLVSTYPDIFETEANWQQSVTTYGVCGKFVYDSVNNTVRLPKITGFTESTIDPTVLGDLVEAGLPNITGGFDKKFVIMEDTGTVSGSGAFSSSVSGTYGYHGWQQNTGLQADVKFDASDSSAIYGNSTTVQPQAIKVLYYIVIATSTKTDIEVDIDEIATDLNGKADIDLTNVNNSGTSRSAGWAMPSDTYDVLTVGASDATYTAPANGMFFVIGSGNSGTGDIILRRKRTGDSDYMDGFSAMVDQGYGAYISIDVKKGDVVGLYYNRVTVSRFLFVYAQGSESEA